MQRPGMTDAERADFIREHTDVRKVPLVPEVSLYTVSELVPLWRATETWLDARGIAVPFWCVAWAGGQALARWILDHRDAFHGKDVVDFGAGSGLVGIAAAIAGASRVRVIDVDPFAWAACAMNAEINGVSVEIVRASEDSSLDSKLEADILLAGDVWYERAPAVRFAGWMRTLAARGMRVMSADPGRPYAPPAGAGTRELGGYDVPTSYDLESAPTKRARVFEFGRTPKSK